MNHAMRAVLVLLLISSACLPSATAQYRWSGAGPDDSWATPANWTSNAAPPLVYTGQVVFTNTDLGNPNVLDADRRIVGTSGNTAQGLAYNAGSPSPLAHQTDLNGFTLAVDGGTLQVGYNVSNSAASIANGTLQIGGTNRTDVFVGVNSAALNLQGTSVLTVAASVNASNVASIMVGRHSAGNAANNRGGVLDLRAATLYGPGGANTLKANGDLYVGANVGGPSFGPVRGALRLPASLASLEVSNLWVGYERLGVGQLDFGTGSALTNLAIRGSLWLSYDGHGEIIGLPSGASMSVGQPTVPASVRIANIQYGGQNLTGTLVVANGRFSGTINDLYLGHMPNGNSPTPSGRLDVASCAVAIGGAENRVRVPGTLLIGSRSIAGEGDANVFGILRLPPAITNIDVGTLQLGHGYHGYGILDIGPASQLQTLNVATGLYIGGGYAARIGTDAGGSFVDYLPAGLAVTVGRTNVAAPMQIGVRYANPGRVGNGYGALILTNGSFRARLSTLQVGLNTWDTGRPATGILDLAGTTIDSLMITSNLHIGGWAATSNKNGFAYVRLPAATVTVASNLFVGDAGRPGAGVLELFGTTISVGRQAVIGSTAAITVHVGAASSGIDVPGAGANDFSLAPSGLVHIVFEADPTNATASHWGLRVGGNRKDYLLALAADQRLTWSTPGVSSPLSDTAGVYYDASALKTYVGIPGTAVPPDIENVPPTNVTFSSACLNGYLASTGSSATTVSVYWGDTDAGAPSAGGWAFTNSFASGDWGSESFPSTNVTLSESNHFYYYRYAAANAAGSDSAATSTVVMTGEIWIDATAPTGWETGPVSATVTVHRLSASTNAAITVNYAIGGSALIYHDYVVSPAVGSVVIPAGADRADVTLTPILNPTPESEESAVFTLLPGAYIVGSPAAATLTIVDAGTSMVVTATDCGPWTGVGLDDSWGTAANWASNAIPALVYTGRVVFLTNDMGNVNTMEASRTINGPSLSLTNGLHYNFIATATNLGHTTDLAGNTLTLNGGSLQAGYMAPNSIVTIRSGTLVLGGSNRTDVQVGIYTNGSVDVTGVVVALSGALDTRNAGSINVARTLQSGANRFTDARLDLRDATLVSGDATNALILSNDLSVAQTAYTSVGGQTRGVLQLPATLQAISVQGLYVGHERHADGTIDFGAGSALTGLTVRGALNIESMSGHGRLTNMPANIALSVGTPAAPGSVAIGTYSADPAYGSANTAVGLGITNGSFQGYLSSLAVGQHLGGNPGTVNALLDLSSASVAVGGAPDLFRAGSLIVGSKDVLPAHAGVGMVKGTLRLPPAITNITVGTLAVGTRNNAQGLLDIGSNSMLRTLIVTNSFYLGGRGCIGYERDGTNVDYLPGGIDVRIGTSQRYIPMYLGVRGVDQYPFYGETYGPPSGKLTVSNGTFSAYLTTLQVGVKEDSTKTMTGVLDLRDAQVAAFSISGDAWIGGSRGLTYGPGPENQTSNGFGYVYLPGATVVVSSNLLVGDTTLIGRGHLELFGSRLTVSNKLEVGETGIVTTHVSSASCGLDIRSASTNNLEIRSPGRIHLAFERVSPGAWGLRMAGNQTEFFRVLHESGRLTWSLPGGRDAQILYDGSSTIVRHPQTANAVLMIR